MSEESYLPPSGLRHLYTSAAEGSLGEPGFQTVACAQGLEEGLHVIEDLVRGYRNPDPGEGHRTRQLVQLPADPSYCVFSTIQPTGSTPEGRAGNFWAESLVAPVSWLADGNWDVDAAFDQLSWAGPAMAATVSGWPAPLPAEPLEPLIPDTLDRLGLLTEYVSGDALDQLLQALARQVRGGERIFVVEVPDRDPSAFERLITLLPLALPPTVRASTDQRGRHPLQLRTRGTFDDDPPVDIQGMPAAAIHERRRARGMVIDLGGRLSEPLPGDGYGQGYAVWLREVLENRDWEQLASYYSRAAEDPSADPIARFAEATGKPGPARGKTPVGQRREAKTTASLPATAPTDTPGSEAWRQRAGVWAARGEAEREAYELRELYRDDVEQLRATLEVQIDESERNLQAEIKRSVAAVQQGAKQALEDISLSSSAEIDKLANQRKRTLASILEAGRVAIEEISDKAEVEVFRISSQSKELTQHLETVGRKQTVAARRKPLPSQEEFVLEEVPTPRAESDSVPVMEGHDTAPEEEQAPQQRPAIAAQPSPPAKTAQDTEGMGSQEKSWAETAAEHLGQYWPTYTFWAIIIIGIAAIAYFSLAPIEPTSRESPEETPATQQQPTRDELLKTAVDQLVDGRNVAAVLRHMTGISGLKDRAAVVYLKLVLKDRQFDENMSYALLQAALRGWKEDISVDGFWGAGTQAVLKAAAKETCCDGKLAIVPEPGIGSDLAACFLERYLRNPQGPNEGCPEEDLWPLRSGRSWTLDEAARALKILRIAYQETEWHDILKHDLAARPAIANDIAAMTLSEDEATLMLLLAHQTLSGEVDSKMPSIDELRREDLEAVIQSLRQMSSS